MVRAAYPPSNIDLLHNMSVLADCSEILGWLENFEQPPQRTLIILGDPEADSSLHLKIEDQSSCSR